MVPDLGKDWQRFEYDAGIARWAEAADRTATRVLKDPEHAHQYRYQRTWFVGVDALPNARNGSLDGIPLEGAVIDSLSQPEWHAAQLSVTFPGYPQPMEGESVGQHRFRVRRDAAHVDGLLPEGPRRRRHLIEPHAFILGLPLNDVAQSPLVVWEDSAEIMRNAFAETLSPYPAAEWHRIDLTDAYQAARKRCLETCERVVCSARPGEAVLVHRLALHGVAPWKGTEQCPSGRRIAYFRPLVEDVSDWLNAP